MQRLLKIKFLMAEFKIVQNWIFVQIKKIRFRKTEGYGSFETLLFLSLAKLFIFKIRLLFLVTEFWP